MGGSNDPNVNENQKDTITTNVKLDQIIIFTNDIKISQNKLINSINSIRDENKKQDMNFNEFKCKFNILFKKFEKL